MAALLVPAMPVLPVLAPVPQTVVLLVPALAACAVVGWWQGGRLALAVVWIAVAVWLLSRPLPGGDGYASLARGWGVLLAGTFGLLCVLRPRRAMLDQALPAVALSLVLALVALLTRAGPIGDELTRLVRTEYAERAATWLAWLDRLAATPEWAAYAAEHPETVTVRQRLAAEYAALPDRSILVLPAVLALESLAVLALAWALYQRLARTRIGPPLGRLREFRFNDQLVWGLIVGITLVLVDAFGELRGAGINLLVFFGALYVVRGLGVLAWLLAPRGWVKAVLVVLAIPFWQLLAPFALVVGVGDTWLDWRSRARPTS